MKMISFLSLVLLGLASCGGPDATCSPGNREVTACGDDPCAERERRCGDDGAWGEWSECRCEESECDPGHLEVAACDDPCEEQTRTCSDDRHWSEWSECRITLECQICVPDELEWEACGDCSVRTRTCSAESLWLEWTDCEELAMPERCDGLDNDCDGEVDEGSACEPCGLAQVGESQPITDLRPLDFIHAGERRVIFTGTTWVAEMNLQMHSVDDRGELLSAPVDVELPELFLHKTGMSNILWNGSEFIFFATIRIDGHGGYIDPEDPDREETEVWMVRLSAEGERVETHHAFSLPPGGGGIYNVSNIRVSYDEARERYLVGIECWREDGNLAFGATIDADGGLQSEVHEYSTGDGILNLCSAQPTHDGHVALWLDTAADDIVLQLLDEDGAELDVLRHGADLDDFRVIELGLEDGNIIVLIGYDRDRVATIFSFDLSGELEAERDIPWLDEVRSSIYTSVVEGGEIAVVMHHGLELLLARYNRMGELEGAPVVVKHIPDDGEQSIYGIILSRREDEYAFVYTGTQSTIVSTRYNMVAPIDCEATCEDSPFCAPGEREERSCGRDVGICESGLETRTCRGSCTWEAWQPCAGAIWPEYEQNEACTDGLDNDCDDLTDIDDNTCTICDAQPDHWLCDWCMSYSAASACFCIDLPEVTEAPCGCILSGSEDCNCELDLLHALDYCW